MIYADGIDVHARGNVRASHNCMLCERSTAYDIRALYGLCRGTCGVYRDSEAFSHVRTKFLAARSTAAVRARHLQLSNAGNRFQLGPRLPTSSDNGRDSRVATGHEFSRHARRSTRSQLAHIIRFNLRHKIAGSHFVEQNQEANLASHVGVLLFSDEPAWVIGGRHVMIKTLGQFEAATWLYNHFSASLFT